ncbi:HAMP domain-containing sensor histidine kinase [Sulfuricurvum sp.]|uniref:sensor histidine kinase n=1 Tax=Sulfuricurvum sp. TaxID=2025608 RepID=UPI002E357811|nr:HAMP domain-containing sensor histidine kinase [Sulfuricurvum sp.]HEX5330008.1 HAMP domain-containing sensor histidine kinase [Sulfuricurvum sp.]
MESAKEHEEVEFLSRKILDLNKQLIESEKAKSRFLSLVASELNNPMTALLGLIPHLKPSIDQEKIFQMIHQEALNLHFCVDNLVSAAEIESGNVDIAFATLDIGELLNEVIAELVYLTKERNIIISIHNKIDFTIVSDPRKLALILKNLISNACLYGLRNGIVDIAMEQVDAQLIIAVNNQGNGPKVEFKPQVFTRFAGGPEGDHGMGIGLSIVRELCEQLGGSIDYTVSQEWVTFTATLPLEASVSESDACGANEFLFDSFDGAVEL